MSRRLLQILLEKLRQSVPRNHVFRLAIALRLSVASIVEVTVVLMSGDAVRRGSPLLSPVYEGSNANATKPLSAIFMAYKPLDCSLVASVYGLFIQRQFPNVLSYFAS